ncbi:solute carrier family 25 (mitochondrial phosphate transporter), member 3 [Geosmithia morbida]|uniref:Solute carrier family 25 (Mitochondrial phosphate transporter), member 3 n=1 Tax=Geosmithia morbida TaxID=1094350 RepID=A0A9P4YU57_9HYPO|nr:solute carrier family 25 (mitochondrial phosphate transporter), member 3 [Geosmithia morbida]KAF4122125.1 solute carrier family 25 (mitochondrial phosphate transporter), member 3 [Geosmithia morbida]
MPLDESWPLYSVKTRIQLDPSKYSSNLVKSGSYIAKTEGAGALLTGLGPTVTGYCLQGAFKFGGYEFFKARAVDALGYETAANNRNAVYLASSAAAEFLGDLALCPFESVRIRLVSQPSYAPSFAAIQTAYTLVDKESLSSAGATAVNLGSGLVAGLAAAVVSQPADTLLSQVNKDKAREGESTGRRLIRIGTRLGVKGAFAGMQARAIMVGGMTAVQFGIYGDVKKLFDVPDGVDLKKAAPAK